MIEITISGEELMRWAERKGYSYKEPYNSYDAQTQLSDILDFAKSKARSPGEANKFREGTPMGRGIDSTISDDLERLNREYISETSPIISRTNTLEEINKISIDERYERKTVNRLRTQLGSRKSFFERVETRKEIFLRDPEREIRLANRRTWGAVQRYYELSDSELSKLKSQLGEDFLR